MARPSSSTDLEVPAAKRLEAMQAIGRHTKTSTVQMLMHLQSSGILAGNATERSLRREIQAATEAHGSAMTPYGPVVQQVRIGAPGLEYWEVCHPFAFLWYMTRHSAAFRDVMRRCTSDGCSSRLVIYMDGLKPGNPFRPDKSRSLMCIYWCLVDWPAFMLSRTFAWPCLSILRESVIDKLPGGCSYLARLVLRIFFPTTGDSFDKGILIEGPDGSYVIKAIFCGWLADLKEHKSITEWKGVYGNVGCLKCKNLSTRARGHHADGTIGLDCGDVSKFVDRTTSDIDDILAELERQKPILAQTPFKQLETDRGINYVPDGIIFDRSLREIYNPPKHIIVDWQHTFCSDGVANTCIWTTMYFLRQRGFTNESVRNFMTSVHMPSKYGKVDPAWLHDNRLKGNTLTSFSNIVLHLMPIIFLYLDTYCSADAVLQPVCRYFKKLYMVVGTLASGPEEAPHYWRQLRKLLKEFHELHESLSEDLKPKLHQMHHVVDGMLWLGKLLSCFVCERKHRVVKDSALHVFRHIEHTVIHDVVNKQCEQLMSGIDLFKETVLVDPRVFDGIPSLRRSLKAVMPMGVMHTNDVIWMEGGRCGRIKMFYEFHEEFLLHVAIYSNAGRDPAAFDERQSTDAFIDVREVVDACTWFYQQPSIIKVAVPPIAVFKM